MTSESPSTIHSSSEDAALSQSQARSEIEEYLHISKLRRHLFPRAALVGVLAGVTAVAFRAILAGGDSLRNLLIREAHRFPALGCLAPMLLGMAGAVLALFLVRRFAPEASGSGIPNLEAVLHRFREMRWQSVLPVKFFGGALAIGAGMSLGREGPTVQMGGAVGIAVAERLNAPTQERLTLIAAGAGAGLAAAFNAPLAGLIFVLEEVQRDFRQAVFGAAFIAAALANIIARFAAGQLPVFQVPNYPVPSLSALPVFALLGILCGLFGVVFNRSLVRSLDIFAKIPDARRLLAAGIVGALVGLIAYFSPIAVGGGHDLTEKVLDGQFVLAWIPFWFLLRFVLLMACYSTGAPGGIFAPMLVLGALIGLATGQAAHSLFPALIPIPAVFAVVGMAAYFTAIVRAPLTGVVLITEMTGNYGQMLPLLVACFCAYAVAEHLGELPIYERLLERDLLRGGIRLDSTEPIVMELEIEPTSPFVGKRVRELGLPPGCILIRCREGEREWVPTADTLLEPHVRITAVLAPEAREGIALLRQGCEAAEV